MGLAQNAAALAGREAEPDDVEQPHLEVQQPAGPVELPDLDAYEPGPNDPEQVPVHIAWNRLMRSVRAIAKGGAGGRFTSTNAGSYDFRGVDRTVNAFGPAVREHGITIMPVRVTPTYTQNRTQGGKVCRECTVVVQWRVYGPKGDHFPDLLESAGEALDYADKATAKAQSVALRVLLLTSAMVPTGDPDPDRVRIERGEQVVRPLVEYRDEIVDPRTSVPRLRTIRTELRQQGHLAAVMSNEHGDEEELGRMIDRIGAERAGGAK